MANNMILRELDENETNCHIVDFPELCHTVITESNNIKVLHLNIRSIQHNFDRFLLTLARIKVEIDVIVLTECWIHEHSVIPQIGGYASYRTNKCINKSGGVVVYVKLTWEPEVTEPQFQEANCLRICLNKNVSILAIYRSPSFKDLCPFLTSLESTVNTIKHTQCIIVTGDININICPDDPSDISESYLCLLAELNLMASITKPTRNDSCLDHINVTSKFPVVSVICKSDITDHDIVIAGIKTKINNQLNKGNRYIKKLNYEGIVNETKSVDWSDVLGTEDVNHATQIFSSTLTHILRSNTISKRVSRSKFAMKPWMTPGLIRCSKHRDHLHSKVRSNPTDVTILKIYTRYRNFYNNLLRKLKQQHDTEELHKSKGNLKKLWHGIRQISHTNQPKKVNLDLTRTKNNICDSLSYCNDYFTKIGLNLAERILSDINETQESLANKVRILNSPLHSLFLNPTDEVEIEALILTLKSDSAPGADGITNRLLKIIRPYIVPPLTHICNLSISKGTFPDIWKTAIVTPIHKAGNKSDPCNYRPISLLGSFSKILEKIVHKRIIHFIETNNLLSNSQFGFRQGKSTEDAVSDLTNKIVFHLDKSDKCIGVFLDLAKAFDTVSIPILLRKLELSGFRGQTLDWFKSYLSGRTQRVKVDSHLSSLGTVNFGVPQGSILGPTLFLLYINDLASIDLINANIFCYADDTAIIFHGRTWEQARFNTETGLAKIVNWLRENLLTLNTAKTNFVCFHKTAKSAPPQTLDIKTHVCKNTNHCRCLNINRTTAIKYLGVVLDEKLSFKEHLIVAAKRTRKLIYVFKNLRSVADLQLLREIYIAICQSVLSYCISIWGGSGVTNMLPLERSQRAIIKIILRKPIRYPTAKVYSDSNLLSVRGLFILRVILRVHRTTKTLRTSAGLTQKRVICLPTPRVSTTFAKRFTLYLHHRLYNRVNKECSIFKITDKEVKSKVENWLANLKYPDIENVIRGFY